MTKLVRYAVAVVVAAALAACSSSTGGHGATPPTAAALGKIVLQQSDLPSGWAGKAAAPDSSSSSDNSLDAQLASCIGGKKIDTSQEAAKVQSDDFTQGEETISSDATSYKSQAEVDNRSSLITSSRANECFNKVVRVLLSQQAPAGAKIDKVALHLTPGSNGGPANVAATEQGTLTLTADGQTVDLYLDAAFIRGKLLTATVEFEGVGQRVDPTLQKRLVADVAKRAAAG